MAVLGDRDLQPETFPAVTGLDCNEINCRLGAGWPAVVRRRLPPRPADRLARAGTRRGPGLHRHRRRPGRGHAVRSAARPADAVRGWAGFGLIETAGKATRLQDQGSIDTRGATRPADQRRCADGSGHRPCVGPCAALCARAPDHRGRSGRGQSAGRRPPGPTALRSRTG